MRLETKRLILRQFQPEDGPDLQQILGDQQVMALCEPPYCPAKTAAFLADFCIGQGKALAVVRKEEGRLIGYLLFKPLDLEQTIWEIGWFFNRRFWRQGYALEAASARIAYAFERQKIQEIQAETADPVKSARLMEKLGMVFAGSTPVTLPDGSAARLLSYRLSRQQWQTKQHKTPQPG